MFSFWLSHLRSPSLFPSSEDHAASLANAREGYIEEAVSKAKIAEVERVQVKLARELDAARLSQKGCEDRALIAEREAKKNRDASDATIVQRKKKYQRLKGHVLNHFRGSLGKHFSPPPTGESRSL